MTEAKAAVLRFLEGLRTYITVGRLAHVGELTEAQDQTLDQTEQIVESLETEIENDTN
jgi:flagellar biosynthesis/type III secretory pathway ATPase